MKKLIAGVVTASALTFGGLAAAGVSPVSAGAPYVVQPVQTVTTATAGHTFTLKFNSGVVGMPTQGKVRWTYVKTPKGFKKGGKRTVRTLTLKNSALKLNLRGHAFPVRGTYKLKFQVVGGGSSFTVKVKVK